MVVRNALIGFGIALFLIGLISIGAIWEIYQSVESVETIGSYRPETCELECPDCHPTTYKPGDTTEDGKLVTFVCGGRYRVLESDYALAFRNDGDAENPKAVFALSSRDRAYEEFTELAELVKRLKTIPEPIIIDYYSTCGGGPHWGIPRSELNEFYATMDALKVELASERNGIMNIICLCPCENSK